VGKFGNIFENAPKDKAEVLLSDSKTPKPSKSNRGRPAGHAGGKRSDPKFTQKLVYLKSATIEKADHKVRAENKTRDKKDQVDFSDLIQSLLENWVNS
jgi:hypothetical protein